MEKYHKFSVSFVVSAVAFTFGLVGPIAAFAATSPSLGAAGTYGILSNLFQHNIAATTITGDPANSPTTGVLGYSSEAGVGAVVVNNGTTYVNDATWTAAGVAQNAALNNVVDGLNIQSCTSVGATVDLSSIDTDGPGGFAPGTFPPGCYSSTGAMDIGSTITLSGSGTYIFKPNGALNTAAGSIVTLSGASACNVFWAPTQAATLGANSTFKGTLIDPSGVTMSNLAAVTGRILAYGGTVTADSNTVTVPVCAVSPSPSPAPASGAGQRDGFITVVKLVINDGGGTKSIEDFPLFVNDAPMTSGMTRGFPAPSNVYTITETADPNYNRTFSGDCDSNGQLNLSPGSTAVCIVTNDDKAVPVVPPVPPLIDVIKVPSPLALPAGPGSVQYTYTLRNVGTVPVTNITMVGDTCSPIILVSGDTNSNANLEVDETWTYRCSTTLAKTHTNTVVATGWANGLSAVDIANATVVVGAPVVPPLIHVTKIPSPLTLSAGGGLVTYTKIVTNPGTVALSNVRVTDDKCSPMNYISGDMNANSRLDTNEAWTYICRTNLTKTTTNTAVASGEANGLTARDFAVATVVVVPPKLPNTGFAPGGENTSRNIILFIGIFALVSVSALVLRRRMV